MRSYIIKTVLSFFIIIVFVLPLIAFSQSNPTSNPLNDANWTGLYTCVGSAKSIINCSTGVECSPIFGTSNYCTPSQKCSGDPKDKELNAGKPVPICSVLNIMGQVNRILNIMFYVFIPAATFMIIFAGFKLLSASADKRGEAKVIFQKVLLGFLFMCGAFGIVKLIMNYLTTSDFTFLIN